MLIKKQSYNASLELGPVSRYRNLAAAPVCAARSMFEEPVRMLDEVLSDEELSKRFSIEGVEVNAMRVKNKLEDKVLIVGGATIEREGGQKRYATFPCLVMPDSKINLPVNCAEVGEPSIRGRYNGNTAIVSPDLRAGVVEQGDAWDRINNTTVILRRMNPTRFCQSGEYDTGSYIDNIDKKANVEDYVEAIGKEPIADQIGIVAGIRCKDKKGRDRTIYYTDFFGNHEILEKVYAKLAKCFRIVALANQGNEAEDIDEDKLSGFLRRYAAAECKETPHVGGGKLYLFEKDVSGSMLRYQEKPVQVTMRETALARQN
jgi:hypothetical protein